MEITILKQKIHQLIDESNDEILQSVYQLLNEEEYTDEFKKNLDDEYLDYQKNGNTISFDEMLSLVKNF